MATLREQPWPLATLREQPWPLATLREQHSTFPTPNTGRTTFNPTTPQLLNFHSQSYPLLTRHRFPTLALSPGWLNSEFCTTSKPHLVADKESNNKFLHHKLSANLAYHLLL
ncbi:MAG: hypothetical protein F6K53_43285 [Moorea sp. SIO4A1]|uniref:hypothetical protein n=1 Tax=Moorena sp. SIO4A1 TaxID=2607835 RepID=UPI001450DCF8|nr:hypothetical protein [Moorena sp. SIO4A1]NEQ63762.1 hypothetical protein [Moorena sp. SIO4A1]